MAKVAKMQLGYGQDYIVPLALIPYLENAYRVKQVHEDLGDGKGKRYVTRRVSDVEENIHVEVVDTASILPELAPAPVNEVPPVSEATIEVLEPI